ncbi:hypothetical protein AAT17_01055 [Nonlabens sp. MIC269]|uniref:hypothetical protein n=1 Tax=Nonlabens sp. MIC269 TaxID=1476901 RepID=UPI0007215E45|nr:hypothetical protein [Nonlabens sp. MIC269]ALM19943.1 hypothetical protein AAT17_01055 [Nonlabens sp. MIC269]
MKTLFNIVFLLMVPVVALAGTDKGKYTKTKTLNKSFPVKKTCMLQVENSFGNVSMTTWDKAQIDIKVVVEVSGDDEDDVVEKLREINVDFDTSSSRVIARTDADFSNRNQSSSIWNALFSSNSNRVTNMKIDYIIKLPKTADIDIANDYGNVEIDDLFGHAKIQCDFGRIDIGNLHHEDNLLKFDYSKNCHFDYIKSATIRADFSGFELEKAYKIEFSGDYTTGKFGEVDQLNFRNDFTTVQIESVRMVTGRGDYSTVKIDNVSEYVNLNTEFGSARIRELGRNFKEAILRAEYTKVDVGVNKDASFTFDIDTEFAGINLSNDIITTKSNKNMTEKSKAGHYGSSSASSTININSSFGGVSLKIN